MPPPLRCFRKCSMPFSGVSLNYMPILPYWHINRYGKYTHGPVKNQPLNFEETVTFPVFSRPEVFGSPLNAVLYL